MKVELYSNEMYRGLAEAVTPEQIFAIGNALTDYSILEIRERYESLTKKIESLDLMTPLNPKEIAKSALILMLAESKGIEEAKIEKKLIEGQF
ncbi:hypothetical protein HOG16_03500 [Candidatus Woesearchaeota archaeon]|nr:hypothetical protein [Candidatus Woesearchaeota archaeon]MBT4321591.1 hypothetical protein [Candidatus Woesearchaeota archaeon]MBT4631098.1 hypothetical protein [Candidatus Woesearchaeota archaeon]